MMEGLALLQGRIAELQSMVGVRPTFGVLDSQPSSGTSTAFASVLEHAQQRGLGDGTDPLSSLFTGASNPSPAAGAATGTFPGTTTGADVVAAGRKYLGVPYLWGGTDPAHGLDCSGFVQRVYQDLGVHLPRVSAQQAKAGTPVGSIEEAKPGDLIAFDEPVGHIGIYLGAGKIIVSPHSGANVRIEDIGSRHPTAIRRILPSMPGVGSPESTATSGHAIGAGVSDHPVHTVDGLGGPYADLYRHAGAKYGVDPLVLSAIGWEESRQHPDAVSSAGAIGVMQIMPGTAKSLGIDPHDPAQAIDGAARLLSSHLARFKELDLALAAYGAGAGAVLRYGGVPPYAETRNYIRKIHELITPEAS